MPHRARRKRELDESLNPSDHFDPKRGIGKDPEMSGPRGDEADLDPLGEDPTRLCDENPRDRAMREGHD